jgi:1-acyl-sn-glycerol-3-phosphate acyltransferase
MPPVTNYPLYAYRIFIKLFCFFFFGVSVSVLIIILMPLFLLVFHPVERFRRVTRRIISGYFRFFVLMMRVLGIVRIEIEDKSFFYKLKSKIVVANHPSLVDTVIMISLLPNAVAIPRADLKKNIFLSAVVSKLYILASSDFNEMAEAVKLSLDQGSCIIIFPEGTRTPRKGKIRLKKGAARFSVLCGADIIVTYIGGNDKYGMGKGDSFFSFNHKERWLFRIKYQKTLSPEKYKNLETYSAVKKLNDEMLELFENPVNL